MHKRQIVSGAVTVLIFSLLGAGTAKAQAAKTPGDYDPKVNYDCDRACLNSFVDRYLAALVARDPSLVPLARDVKFTENGQLLRIGDGFWGTASGPPTYKLYAADPQGGQVMFMGVLPENGAPVIFCVRLKVELRKITEIETVVSRKEP